MAFLKIGSSLAQNHEENTGASQINPSDPRVALNAVFRDSLPPISFSLGALYFIIAISHALLLPHPSVVPMSLLALFTGVTLLLLRFALSHWQLPERWAHPLGAGIATLVLLNCLLHFYYFPKPQQTTNILLLIVGVGFLFISTKWLTLIILTALTGWAVLVWAAPPSPDWLHFGFALYMATVLAVVVHTVRVRSLQRLEMLRLQDARRKAEMESALRSTEEARRAAEAARNDLMQSEARLRLVTNQMPAVLWTTDTELRVTSSLGMGLTALDLQPQEVLEMMRLKYSTADAPEFLPIVAHRRALSGESVPYEISWKRHTFGCQVEPLRGAEGKLIGTLGIAFDITGRKLAEETLRQSEEQFREKYRVLYDDNPSMYFTVDTTGRVLSVNRFGAEQLGYTVDELEGQSVLNVFYDEDKPEVVRQVETCLQNPKKLHTWELRKVHKDGHLLCVRETARATWDTDGKLVVFIVCEDITSHKRLEDELQRYTKNLEKLVTERAMHIQMLERQL